MDEVTKSLLGLLNGSNTLAAIGVISLIFAYVVWRFFSKTFWPQLSPHIVQLIRAACDFFQKITELGEKHEHTLKLNTELTQQIHTRMFSDSTHSRETLDKVAQKVEEIHGDQKKILAAIERPST